MTQQVQSFAVGQQVRWNQGRGPMRGTITARFERKVSRRLAAGLITRFATPENPVFLITLDQGGEALVFGSELSPN